MTALKLKDINDESVTTTIMVDKIIDKMTPDSFWRVCGIPHGELVETDGTIKWYWHGELDRRNGPAVIEPNGNKRWYSRGIMHRIDGPAAVYVSNLPDIWVVDGRPVNNFREFQEFSGLSDEDILFLKIKYGNIK